MKLRGMQTQRKEKQKQMKKLLSGNSKEQFKENGKYLRATMMQEMLKRCCLENKLYQNCYPQKTALEK